MIKPKEQQKQKNLKLKKKSIYQKRHQNKHQKTPNQTCKNALQLRLISFSMNKFP